MATGRIDKVNSLLRREVGGILLKEFYFSGAMVSITRVETSSNLIEAKVFVSAYPESELNQAIKILNNNIYGIQKKIDRALKMRPVPKIRFIKDEEIAKSARVEELLSQLKK
jgi:ribosome-binding factor A